jgi:uncharacterized protein
VEKTPSRRARRLPYSAAVTQSHLVVFHSPGPAWEPGLPLVQQVGIQSHRAHYAKLQQEGKLLLGGPFADSAGGGMMVCRDIDEDALRMHALSDPAVESGLLQFEIRAWVVALQG